MYVSNRFGIIALNWNIAKLYSRWCKIAYYSYQCHESFVWGRIKTFICITMFVLFMWPWMTIWYHATHLLLPIFLVQKQSYYLNYFAKSWYVWNLSCETFQHLFAFRCSHNVRNKSRIYWLKKVKVLSVASHSKSLKSSMIKLCIPLIDDRGKWT